MTLQHPDARFRPLLSLCALSLVLSACHQPRTHAPATPASIQSNPTDDTPDGATRSRAVAPSASPSANPFASTTAGTTTGPRRYDFLDANGNGVDDAIDITFMNSADENHNGIPDEAELDW